MNTPDKILLALSCHASGKCSECPYEDQPECSSKLAADAGKMLKAAIKDVNRCCATCIHYNSKCGKCTTNGCFQISGRNSKWQWRGVEVE